MTNYNDGKWHGWNGGKCPVHPETVVEYTGLAYKKNQNKASKIFWDCDVVAFRVVEEYKEPRDRWANEYKRPDGSLTLGSWHESEEKAKHWISNFGESKYTRTVRFREVVE